MAKSVAVLGMVMVLFPAFLFVAAAAYADDQQGQRDCAKLRSAVLLWVGDRSKDMLFTSRDMSADGQLDANVANSAFKDVQIAVMYFDHAYEDVPKTREACLSLALRFGTNVGTYIDQVIASGTRPVEGIAPP